VTPLEFRTKHGLRYAAAPFADSRLSAELAAVRRELGFYRDSTQLYYERNGLPTAVVIHTSQGVARKIVGALCRSKYLIETFPSWATRDWRAVGIVKR
jgi:hypothetical protein